MKVVLATSVVINGAFANRTGQNAYSAIGSHALCGPNNCDAHAYNSHPSSTDNVSIVNRDGQSRRSSIVPKIAFGAAKRSALFQAAGELSATDCVLIK